MYICVCICVAHCAICATCNTHTDTHFVWMAPIECKWSNSVSCVIKCVSCVLCGNNKSVANATSRLNGPRKEMLQHGATTTTATRTRPASFCVSFVFLRCAFIFNLQTFRFVSFSFFDAVQWLKRQNAQKLVYNFSCCCCCCCCCSLLTFGARVARGMLQVACAERGDSLKRWASKKFIRIF